MSDDTMTPGCVVRRGSGEPGTVSLSGIEGRGRAVNPLPPDDSWYDWPFDDVLDQIYDWSIANLTEIIGVGEKIGQALPGLFRGVVHAGGNTNLARSEGQ